VTKKTSNNSNNLVLKFSIVAIVIIILLPIVVFHLLLGPIDLRSHNQIVAKLEPAAKYVVENDIQFFSQDGECSSLIYKDQYFVKNLEISSDCYYFSRYYSNSQPQIFNSEARDVHNDLKGLLRFQHIKYLTISNEVDSGDVLFNKEPAICRFILCL
jgi:hypothetical protein